MFSSVSALGEPFVWTLVNSVMGISHCAQDLVKTGGFQPVGAVVLGHPGYETAAPCIID
jgi:hypothetical protein